MTREMIMNELKNRGYEVDSADVIKNGVTLHGVVFGNGTMRPNIYIDDYIKDYSDDELEDVVDMIVYQYRQVSGHSMEFDSNSVMNWDYAKTHLQLCLQKQGDEDIVKRNFLDLEQYVRVIVSSDDNGMGSFKVKPEHLVYLGVSEDVLFNAAWDCTRPTLVEEDMAKIIAEMMGLTVQQMLSVMGDAPKQIILSNQSKIHGAIAMCDTWLLSEIAHRYETDLVILPSSIHEVIVMPVDDKMQHSDLDAMVKDVNETQVAPEEVLSNHAYRFNRNTMEITY